MPKIDVAHAPLKTGSRYPKPFDAPCRDKSRRKLAEAAGLTRLGINLLELSPGAWSSQRHWHDRTDEFVWVVEGEVTLVTNAGEQTLRAGECAAFRGGDPDAHHLQNRSERRALVLEVGSREPHDEITTYSDIDMVATPTGYFRQDGSPYAK